MLVTNPIWLLLIFRLATFIHLEILKLLLAELRSHRLLLFDVVAILRNRILALTHFI